MTQLLQDVALAFVVAGSLVMASACVGALLARNTYHRLHFTAPLSSLGGPLVAVGLAIRSGADLETASILVPMLILFFTGPVINGAIARMAAQREGRVPNRSPK